MNPASTGNHHPFVNITISGDFCYFSFSRLAFTSLDMPFLFLDDTSVFFLPFSLLSISAISNCFLNEVDVRTSKLCFYDFI